MIDPEVARLRRLRDEALRVREIARRLGLARSDTEDSLFERGACASWRIVRLVTGKLIEHPYLGYQQGVGVGSLVGNRIVAQWIALLCKDRPSALKAYAAELESLSRSLDDARALTRSTEYSDVLGRSQAEIKTLLLTATAEMQGAEAARTPAEARVPARTLRTSGAAGNHGLVGELAKGFEGDWPYLAF